MNENILKYKEDPEGSIGKKIYDKYTLTFDKFLSKYYSGDCRSKYYKYWYSKFIEPLFNVSKEEYNKFLNQAKPNFSLNVDEALSFYNKNCHGNAYDEEILKIFSFLSAIDFFKDFQSEEWMNIKYWQHPWDKETSGIDLSIKEILDFEYGVNYLKETICELPRLS